VLILGLTGRSGSGKGYISELFAFYQIPSIDCDLFTQIVYAPASPCLAELARAFGSDILDENGALLRKKLAQRAFASEKTVQTLNAITHPHILRALQEKLENYRKNGCRAILLDAPTLFESGLNTQCDRIICVTSNDELRMERIILRDTLTKEDAKIRLLRQKSDDEFRALSDYEIINDGTQDCEMQVKQILKELQLL
jgi:dephospho-CoA kinase